MNQLITIDSITIRQDSECRYCLNDLHKAAGGSKAKQPADFMRQQQIKDLITELENSGNSRNFPPVATQRGRTGGTYVVKKLVYAYAMWISPAFHNKVLDAYDTLQTQGVAVAEHAAADLLSNPLKYIEAIIGQAKELQAKLAVAQPKAETFDAVVGDTRSSVSRFVKGLEGSHRVNLLKVKESLYRAGFLYLKDGEYRVYRKHQDLFEEKIHREYGTWEIYATERGKQVLTEMLREGRLILKLAFQD
jgi:phage antirepressor YoqD-like protein